MNTFDDPIFFFVDDEHPSYRREESFEIFRKIVELQDVGCDARKSFTICPDNSREKFDQSRQHIQRKPSLHIERNAFDRHGEHVQRDKRNVVEQRNDGESRGGKNNVSRSADYRREDDRRRFRNFNQQRAVRKESVAAPADLNLGGQLGRKNELSQNNLRNEENERMKSKELSSTDKWKSAQSASVDVLGNTSDSDEFRESEEDTNENRKWLRPGLRKFVDRAVDKDSISSFHEDSAWKKNSEYSKNDTVPIHYVQEVVKPRMELLHFEDTTKLKDMEELSLKDDRNRRDNVEMNRNMNSRINGNYEGENSLKKNISSKNEKPVCAQDSKEMQESVAWRNSLRDNSVFSGEDRSKMKNGNFIDGKVKKVGNNIINSSSKKLNNLKQSVTESASQNPRRSGKSFSFRSKQNEENKLPFSNWNGMRTNMATDRRKISVRKKWTETENQEADTQFNRKINMSKKSEMQTKSDEKQTTVSRQVSKISSVPVRISSRKWSKIPTEIFSRLSKIQKDDQSETSRKSRTKPVSKTVPEQNFVKEPVLQEVLKSDLSITKHLIQENVGNEPLVGTSFAQQDLHTKKQNLHANNALLKDKGSCTSGNLQSKQLCTEEPMVCEAINITSDRDTVRKENYSKLDANKSTKEWMKVRGVSQKVMKIAEACREQRKRSFAMHGFECEKRRRTNEPEEVLDIGISIIENVSRL